MNPRTALILIVAGTVLAAACSGGGSSPTAPAASTTLELVEADLLVGGQSVAGQTLGPGHGQGQHALFRARLTVNGQPAVGHEVHVRFERPTGMMGGPSGQFRLYDDGTHGDPNPGDGIYCFRDTEARYACNGPNMHHGEYHYEFWGQQQHGGPESNHLHVRVRLESL